MDEVEKYFIGTDLKFAFSIEGEGFDMDDDRFEIVVKCGKTEHVVTDDEIVRDDEGTYYLLVDSTQYPSGLMTMVVTAYVPDTDFSDGERSEVGKLDLCYLNHT